MFVNDMLKTYGYTRNKLDHFTISIFNPSTDDWITIKHPTADEYIHLCDRPVIDWMSSLGNEDEIEITVYTLPGDFDTFRKYYSKGEVNA